MKTRLMNSILMPVLLVGIGSVIMAQAQTFTVLHTFNSNNGAAPYCRPVLSGGTLYGTTALGGTSNNGTVFAMNLDGTGFRNLHNFTCSDGAQPQGDLVLNGNTLYGIANSGGYGNGTVFSVNTNGSEFKVLHPFLPVAQDAPNTNADGANPSGALLLSSNRLYGTAYRGGATAPALCSRSTLMAAALRPFTTLMMTETTLMTEVVQ